MTDLRKAAQDVVDAWENSQPRDYTSLRKASWALRAALATCPDCGKPTPEGSVHTCSPQKPDSDAKQRLLEIMRKNGLATGHGDTLTQVIDTLEVELTDMLAKARQDAARYRWLRDRDHWPAAFDSHSAPEPVRGPELDAAIDAAMQQEQGK